MIPEMPAVMRLPVPSSANVRYSNECHTDEKQRQWHQNQLQESVKAISALNSNLCAARVNPAANPLPLS